MNKVVVSNCEFAELSIERKELSILPGMELTNAKCKTEEEAIAACKDADGILNQWVHLTEPVINSLEKCKVISTYSIGVDKIDMKAATKKGIYVCNSPEYNKFEVADHICAMILALSRQLVRQDQQMREGKYGWNYLGCDLYRPSNQTIGFVGFGRIAKQACEKMKAFGMKSICYDPFLSAEQCAAAGAEKVTLDEVMKNGDFVSINVSLLESTYHMITKRELALMKPTAYLINCSRGAIVVEEDMLDALQNKKIAGAGLDAFETEPIGKDHPLAKLDNVIMTPHSAWHTMESTIELRQTTAQQVAQVLSGKKPTHCLNYDEVQKVIGK